MEKTISERKQCPYCKNWDVYEAYNEYGTFGDWCPHCKKGIPSAYEKKVYKEESNKVFYILVVGLILAYPYVLFDFIFNIPHDYRFIYILRYFMVLFSFSAGILLWLQNKFALKIIKIYLLSLCLYPSLLMLFVIILNNSIHSYSILGLIIENFLTLLIAGGLYANLRYYLKKEKQLTLQ